VRGQCAICRVVGPPDRTTDFLCENCVHPLEIRTFCAGCGARATFDPIAGLAFLSRIMPEVTHATGTAIRTECCTQCDTNRAPGQCHVERLSTSEACRFI
jgi:hypothetical protein